MRQKLIPVAVVIVAALLPAFAVSAGEGSVVENAVSNTVDLEALLRERQPRTLAVLKADFPTDLNNLLERIGAAQRTDAGEHAVLAQVFGEMTAIRKKYAAKLTFAPSEALQGVLIRLAYFYDDVLSSAGSEICGRFAQDGAGVLFDLGVQDSYVLALDLQAEAYLDAVAQAIEVPEYNEPAGDADWAAVMAAMVRRGNPLSYVATITTGDRKDPDLCPALAAMFRASAGLDSPAGARTRADLARNLTGY